MPSQMWSKFQRLNKDPSNATSSFVRAYLLNMYPPEVCGALANSNFENVDRPLEDEVRPEAKSQVHLDPLQGLASSTIAMGWEHSSATVR